MNRPPRALVLFSGGLDSMLAAQMLLEQNCQVTGINFYTSFTGDAPDELAGPAHAAAAQIGIPLVTLDVTTAYREILLKPKYGYGAAFNPCLDCKLFFIRQTYEYMLKNDFDFLATGEVVGQRPMSQRKDTLPLAIKLTGNRIVRPLSAKLLPESYPEQLGLLDRTKLGCIQGRGRSEQLAMARHYHWQNVPQPAGGCLLTDHNIGRRVKDWLVHSPSRFTPEDLKLLTYGRHFRLDEALKVVVGRTLAENNRLQANKSIGGYAEVTTYPGASVAWQWSDNVSMPVLNDTQQAAVAMLAAYYSKARAETKEIDVSFYSKTGDQFSFSVSLTDLILPKPI